MPESPQDVVERRELAAIIQEGLRRLPPEQRLTLVLADIEEYKYEEIAGISKTNVGTVKSRLARARALLRDFLLAQGEVLPRKYRYSPHVERGWQGAGGLNSACCGSA